MSNLTLTSKDGGDFKPHPEGIHPAVCVDVIDLGLVKTEFQGQEKMAPKVKLVFESELKTEDGRNCTISKNFTTSLHPKAKLSEFLGKWRGRPVAIGETIDLQKLIGACCTLVISHQQNLVGKTYASIDAVSKPTKKIVPSGTYDPAAARQRIAEWKAKQQGVPAPIAAPQTAPHTSSGAELRHANRPPSAQSGEGNKSGAPATAQSVQDDVPYDPEVGF